MAGVCVYEGVLGVEAKGDTGAITEALLSVSAPALRTPGSNRPGPVLMSGTFPWP